MTHAQWLAELLRLAEANPTGYYRLFESEAGREIVEDRPGYIGGRLIAEAWAMGPGGQVMVKEYNEYRLDRGDVNPSILRTKVRVEV